MTRKSNQGIGRLVLVIAMLMVGLTLVLTLGLVTRPVAARSWSTEGISNSAIAAPPSMATTVTLSAVPNEQIVGENIVLTATAVDTDGLPLEGEPISFATAYNLGTGGFGSLEVTTNISGEASTTVSATLPGSAVFTATATSEAYGMTGVVFFAGEPSNIELTISESVLNSSMQATVVATVTDKHGNMVNNGTLVNFSVEPSALGDVDPLSDTTSGGVASTVFTAGPEDDSGLVRATTVDDVDATVGVVVKRNRLYLPLVLRNYPPPWEIGANSSNKVVYHISICPDNAQVAYAGTSGQGLLKSTDGGESWTYGGLSGWTVYAPAVVSGSGCNTVYAATYGGGVYKSTNGGANWNPANSGLGSLYLNFIVADPLGNLYVATGSNGVYRSTTGAASWSQRGLDGMTVFYLTLDPDDSDRIYAGLSSAQVYKSENGGLNWSQASSGLAGAGNIWGLSVAKGSEGDTVIAGSDALGVFITTDGGGDWDRMWPSGNEQTVYTVQARRQGSDLVFYAGTNGEGVFRSGSGGVIWTTYNNGLGNLNANFLSATDEYIYLGSGGGAWRRQLYD